MTKLSKSISRETKAEYQRHPIVVTIAPLGSQSDALIGLRLKGTRTNYIVLLSNVFRLSALWHGQKIQKAKREARKNGISWKIAKKDFDTQNTIG